LSARDGAANRPLLLENLGQCLSREQVPRKVLEAGVDGYGSLEESFVLDTYYETFGRPPLIVVMHYPNDVDDNEFVVIRGAVGEADPRWTTSLSYLARIAATARAQGASLLIVAIPPSTQLAAPDTRRNYQDVLRRFCEREGVRFVDLLDTLGQRDVRDIYIERDPHWTATGHQAVAEILYEGTKDLLAASMPAGQPRPDRTKP